MSAEVLISRVRAVHRADPAVGQPVLFPFRVLRPDLRRLLPAGVPAAARPDWLSGFGGARASGCRWGRRSHGQSTAGRRLVLSYSAYVSEVYRPG